MQDIGIPVEYKRYAESKTVNLHMREDGDFRKDSIIKEEILNKYLKDNNLKVDDIAFVVDDRKKVVDMWRRRGITCLQCAEGHF